MPKFGRVANVRTPGWEHQAIWVNVTLQDFKISMFQPGETSQDT
jgi:hypothetical protein